MLDNHRLVARRLSRTSIDVQVVLVVGKSSRDVMSTASLVRWSNLAKGFVVALVVICGVALCLFQRP